MAKKSKTYRGQRKRKKFKGCGCFYCIGYDKEDLNNIKQSQIDKETKNILNNII